MWVRKTGVLGLLFLCAGACGETRDGDGDANVAASTADVKAMCDGLCLHDARCTTGTDEDPVDAGSCTSKCIEENARLAGYGRSDLVLKLAVCFAGLECSESDDNCYPEALEELGIDLKSAQEVPDVKACLAKQDECEDTDGNYSDDLCGLLLGFVPAKRKELSKCFDDSCDDVRACLAPVIKPRQP